MRKRGPQRSIGHLNNAEVWVSHVDNQKYCSSDRESAHEQHANDRGVGRRQQPEREKEQRKPEDKNYKESLGQAFASFLEE